ncbi:hypothetical protein [Roseomonas sp. BN140053]|uniref:hypothetical protein n=1 Tax=Roseomonas sp. BN140053 TaxID=3391898 RepID=UPI0039EC049F
MSTRMAAVMAASGAARRVLLRGGTELTGFHDAEFLDGLPVRRIGPGPVATLVLPPLDPPPAVLRLVLAPADAAAFGGLELRLDGVPLRFSPAAAPVEFGAVPELGALEAPIEGSGAGRLELRLGWTLPQPGAGRLAGPLLLAVDRPVAAVAEPAAAGTADGLMAGSAERNGAVPPEEAAA